MRQAKPVKVEFADPSMGVVVCLSVLCCAVWVWCGVVCERMPRASAREDQELLLPFLSRLEGCSKARRMRCSKVRPRSQRVTDGWMDGSVRVPG